MTKVSHLKVSADKDRILGSIKEIKGSLKEAVGRIVGDVKLGDRRATFRTPSAASTTPCATR